MVSAGLRNHPPRDGHDKEDDKTVKDFSRNYMTSIVFESPDEQHFSSVPVSMFDLNSIENRKLLDDRSSLANSLPSSQKSLTSLTQNTRPNNLSLLKNKHQEPDQNKEDLLRKQCELYEGQATTSLVTDRGSPKDQPTSEKLGKDQKPDKSGKDGVVLEMSGRDQMRMFENLSKDQRTEKSNKAQPTSDQTILEMSGKEQIADSLTTNPITSEKSAKKQPGKDQLTGNQPKGLIISDKFSRGPPASWEKVSASIAQQTTDNKDNSERQLSRSLFDLSGLRSMTSTASKSKTNSEDSQPSMSAKLKAEELSPISQNSSAPTKPAKQLTGQPLKPQNQAVWSGRPKPEDASTSATYTRNGPNINSFMKPIQFLSSNHSYQEKKSGPLDSIVEQLEKDLAKAKVLQSVSRPNREYRLVNTDIFGNSISDNNMRNYQYPMTNQEYTYNPLRSHESNRAADRSSSRFQYVDRSKTLSSKIYPPVSMHFFPPQDNKSYLSANVLSAYSLTNAKGRTIPSSEYDSYSSAEGRNPRVNQIKDRRLMTSSEYTDGGPSNRFSVVRRDRPPEKYSEITVDKKSWELKGQMLYKEATKNALKEIMHSPTDTTENMYNTGVWNQPVLGHSGTMLQDARRSPSTSRLLKGYTSHGAWNGSVRVFPDPDVWLAGLHKTTGNQITTFSRPQNNVEKDKDWGHFTVVSPK